VLGRGKSVFSFAQIGLIFDLDKSVIRRQERKFQKYQGKKGRIGRPSRLTEEQHEELVQNILASYTAARQCKEFCAVRFGIVLDRNTLFRLLHSDPRIANCTAVASVRKRR
jgi:transposase